MADGWVASRQTLKRLDHHPKPVFGFLRGHDLRVPLHNHTRKLAEMPTLLQRPSAKRCGSRRAETRQCHARLRRAIPRLSQDHA